VYEVAELIRDPHFTERGAFAKGQVAPVLAGQR
jgi:hypothetical protein